MRKTTGIAFSGGGVKSLTQLGFVSWMEDHHVQPAAVSGTSAGSFIAALVSLGLSAKTVRDTMDDVFLLMKSYGVFKVSPSDVLFNKEIKHGIFDGNKLEIIAMELFKPFGVTHISQVKIPLAIPSVDLNTGDLVVFVSHPEMFHFESERVRIISDISLAQAVRASCSFPLVFSTLEYEDMKLVDGGVRMNCPLELVEAYGVDQTLAITMRESVLNEDELKTGFDVAARIYEIMSHEAEFRSANEADFWLNIPIASNTTFQIKKKDRVVEEGVRLVHAQSKALEIFFGAHKGFNQEIKEWMGDNHE